MRKARHRALLRSGVLWMLVAQVLFSLMGLTTRFAGRGVPWPEVAASRFLVGALIAYGFARARGARLKVDNKRIAWLRTIFGTGSALAVFYTLSSPRIPLGDAVTLNSTGPVFVALLSWPILGERVSRWILAVVPLSMIGAVLVVQPTFDLSADLAMVAIAGAVCYAFAMIFLRKLGPRESSEAVVLHFSIFGTVAMVLLSLLTWKTPDAKTGLFLFLTGFTAGFGQLALTRAYSLDRAARISVLSYLGIVLTHLMAIPVFGEHPSLVQLCGSGLVMVAGVVLAFGTRQESYPGFGGARVGTR